MEVSLCLGHRAFEEFGVVKGTLKVLGSYTNSGLVDLYVIEKAYSLQRENFE